MNKPINEQDFIHALEQSVEVGVIAAEVLNPLVDSLEALVVTKPALTRQLAHFRIALLRCLMAGFDANKMSEHYGIVLGDEPTPTSFPMPRYSDRIHELLRSMPNDLKVLDREEASRA